MERRWGKGAKNSNRREIYEGIRRNIMEGICQRIE